jgi:hypothetical protein
LRISYKIGITSTVSAAENVSATPAADGWVVAVAATP